MNDTRPLIHADGQVLAALDPSVYADSVADHAGWAASRLDAPLELVHVIDRRHGAAAGTNLSGSLSLGAQENLLQELADLDEQRGRVDQARGRLLLDQARERVQAGFGLASQARQRQGSLVDTLLELEAGVRLFVVGKRGEHADFASGHLGTADRRPYRRPAWPATARTAGVYQDQSGRCRGVSLAPNAPSWGENSSGTRVPEPFVHDR